MKKRLLSLLLSLCMVLCLLPTAYADSENYWTNFRNSPYNMAITDAPTPASAETTVEKWAKKYVYACGGVSVYLFAVLL